MRTVLVNKLREKRRRSAGAPAEYSAGEALSGLLAPDDTQAAEELEYRQHLVRKALQILQPEFPATTWKAFQEYVLAGRDAAEVAEEMHLSLGTIYAAKSRILHRLRQELEGLLD